ncbi:hypothetical protein CB1_000278001 [Camelus ferus]|nr:hypothetical protein CB1_000278001 [Camelus ferus]
MLRELPEVPHDPSLKDGAGEGWAQPRPLWPGALASAAPACSSPARIHTYQFDSFLESTRTYLGVESFDEDQLPGPSDDFSVEYLVVGNRNPSRAACQMLCRWLDACLAGSRSSHPCGIMQTPCACLGGDAGDPASSSLVPRGDVCLRDGVAGGPENCLTSLTQDGVGMRSRTGALACLGKKDWESGWKLWSLWGECTRDCGGGLQTRTRTCLPAPGIEGGGCEGGRQQRTRECNGPSYGGAECQGHWVETRDCFLQQCPGQGRAKDLWVGDLVVDGKWQAWASWGGCSVTCGGGTQRRERACLGPFFGGAACQGPQDEYRQCSAQRCPEPHEICGEDSFGAVLWKETPAGEVAAVRCPRNATGLILRRCELDEEGIAYWEPPTYIRCVSIDYRNIQMMTREHLAKAQRGLPGEGVSEVIQTLVEISQDGTSYSGDLLSTIDVLRNMTEIFRRAYYSPTPGDVQNFVQIISNLLAEENRDKWEEAQLMGPNAKELFRLVEDFVDVIGFRMKDLRDAYQVTDNLVLSIHKLPASGATDISFPMKGWRATGDWAKVPEDRVTVSKSVFSTGLTEADDSSVFVVGTVLYRNLGSFLALQRNTTVLNSKVISVTVKPPPRSLLTPLEIEFAHMYNGTTNQTCILWDETDLCGASEPAPARPPPAQVVCTLVAAFLHFFFLSSFCWVLTEAWQSYMAVTGRLRNRLIRKRFLCLGWGLPALVVAISVGFTKARGYSTMNYCWLSLEGGLLYAFVGPAAAVVLVNMVIGILVFNKLVSKDGITDKKLKERAG